MNPEERTPGAGDLEKIAASLTGTWYNTLPQTRCIEEVTVTRRDDCFCVSVRGAGDPAVPWGEVPVKLFVDNHEAASFYAEFRLEGANIQLAANIKLGVLVILSATSFNDGSGRAGYMDREFFCREDVARHFAYRGQTPLPISQETPGEIDFAPFAGTWRNTSLVPDWLERFSLLRVGSEWHIRALAGGRTLDETAVTVYMDNMRYLAFRCSFRLDDREVILAANTQTELIAVSAYHRMLAGPAGRDHSQREFFFRE